MGTVLSAAFEDHMKPFNEIETGQIIRDQRRALALKSVLAQFVKLLSAHKVHGQVETIYHIDGSGKFRVTFPALDCGEIVGTPRLVVWAKPDELAYEYNVTAHFQGETVLIWRFYLSAPGYLTYTEDPDTAFGDFNSENLGERVLEFTYGATVHSPIMAPRTVPRKKGATES
jgi:hypothetical protein